MKPFFPLEQAGASPPSSSDDYVVIIARCPDLQSDIIIIQDVILDGSSVIPIFSDVEHFRREAAGSGMEDQGVLIRKDFLHDMLSAETLLILNPGSDMPVRMRRDGLL